MGALRAQLCFFQNEVNQRDITVIIIVGIGMKGPNEMRLILFLVDLNKT